MPLLAQEGWGRLSVMTKEKSIRKEPKAQKKSIKEKRAAKKAKQEEKAGKQFTVGE